MNGKWHAVGDFVRTHALSYSGLFAAVVAHHFLEILESRPSTKKQGSETMELNKEIMPELSLHLKIADGKIIASAESDIVALIQKFEDKQSSPVVKAVCDVLQLFVKQI